MTDIAKSTSRVTTGGWAKALGISRVHVKRLMRSQKIPGRQLTPGGWWTSTQNELEGYLEELAQRQGRAE